MKLFFQIQLALAALCIAGSIAGASADNKAPTGTIDPSTMTLTFADEFDTLEIKRRRKPGGQWTSGLPYNGNFGKAHFVETPRRGFPFRIEDGVLVIEAQRKWNGKWETGLISSVDRSYNGFAQKYGYFEARMKMPGGAGAWSAFWLLGTGQGIDPYTAEIDIVEFYPRRKKNYETATHVWYYGKGKDIHQAKKYENANADHVDRFNTYGVLITPSDTIFYLNREEVSRFPTSEHHRQTMYILLNLALENQADLDKLESPQRMYVDYVRVYALPEGVE